MGMENDGGMILTGENRRTRRKTCPSATLTTRNPTWIDRGAYPGLCCERPATNRLSHGTACLNALPPRHIMPSSTKPFQNSLYLHRRIIQNDKNKHPCRKRDLNPRFQRPSDHGLRLRPCDHWDRLPIKIDFSCLHV
jgi:hypothetical protein